MNLIDKDSLRITHVGRNHHRKYVHADITDAPTVDAIPVEWLREKAQTPCMSCDNPFDYVLTAWEEENNADVLQMR